MVRWRKSPKVLHSTSNIAAVNTLLFSWPCYSMTNHTVLGSSYYWKCEEEEGPGSLGCTGPHGETDGIHPIFFRYYSTSFKKKRKKKKRCGICTSFCERTARTKFAISGIEIRGGSTNAPPAGNCWSCSDKRVTDRQQHWGGGRRFGKFLVALSVAPANSYLFCCTC